MTERTYEMLRWINSRENAKYIICFRPMYGAAVGIIMCIFQILCQRFDFGQSCFALIGATIPILMSGGIYLAGFMNTSEVLSDRLAAKAGTKTTGHTGTSGGMEQKPYESVGCSGAYALIAAMTFYLLYAGGLSLIRKDRQLALLGLGYVISRALHGMAFVWFPAAERETEKGMVQAVFSSVLKRTLRMILSVILALCFCTCVIVEPIMGMLEALLCMWVWTYYYYMSKKVFGGVTKESAGYFLIICELVIALFVGMFGKAFL